MAAAQTNIISSQPLISGNDELHDMTRSDSVRRSSNRDCINDQQHASTSYYLTLWVIMGMGTLFPYNAVISCVDYFDDLYPGKYIESKIAAVCTVSLFTTTLFFLPFIANPKHQSTAGNMGASFSCMKSPSFRTAFGFTFIITILILFATIPAPTETITLSLTFLVGAADSIAQSGLYVLAASINIRCTAAVSFGSALAGFAVNVLRIGTKAILNDDDERSTHAFFGLSAMFLVVCLLALWLAMKEEVTIRSALDHDLYAVETTDLGHTHQYSPSSRNEQMVACDDDCSDCPSTDNMVGVERGSSVTKITNANDGYDAHRSIHMIEGTEVGLPRMLDYENNETACGGCMAIYLQTLQVTWKPTLMLLLMFFTTLSLFPGVVSEIKSTTDLDSWYPIILITIFNAFDCLGRIIPGSRTFAVYLPRPDGREVCDPQSGKRLGSELNGLWAHIGIPCVVRLIFYPLFILSNELVQSDMLVCSFVAIFGFSNGYIACLCFMVGPTMLVNDDHKDAASLLLLLSCNGGLVAGALFGTVLHAK